MKLFGLLLVYFILEASAVDDRSADNGLLVKCPLEVFDLAIASQITDALRLLIVNERADAYNAYNISAAAGVLRDHAFRTDFRSVVFVHGFHDKVQGSKAAQSIVAAYGRRGGYNVMLLDAGKIIRREYFRDNLYRLSMKGLKLLERAPWPAPHDKVTLCQDKGQSELACRNYVKVLLSDGRRLFSCGTNAFSPQCSWRQLDKINNVLESVKGVAKCPYNPSANITALLSTSGQYYVGSPTDFSGSDPAIYRALGHSAHTLRTNQYNSKWLNEPQFVGSFEDDRFVYFVFREAAVEYINCGKRIYSRIARVCKNDSGGQKMLRDNWTTFVKARLNCSVPGEYPFYYDEIHGLEYLPDEKMLYATFTTPVNSIAGSAICAYNMSAIEEAFRGPFKYQEHPGSAWERHDVPHHQHTQCQITGPGSQQLAESSRYQLMDKAIQPTSSRPLHSTHLERYTHLTAAIVQTKFARTPVLFVATDTGLVKKIALLPGRESSCIIEIWKVENDITKSTIKIIKYLKETESVYIGMENALLRIPTSRCGRHVTRVSCLGAQDPLCGWDERREACVGAPPGARVHWLQDNPACPDTTTPLDGGWSAWSPWEVCLQKNDHYVEDEDGVHDSQDKCLCHTRKCNNPTPRNGGKACIGISLGVSNCTVHGGWTAWSGWSACSASCGVAVKWRRRACGAPAPMHGGRLCVGADRSEIYCTQNPPCPAPVQPIQEAGWSDWGPWSTCSAPCGGGARWRQRHCDSPPPVSGGPPCTGCSTEAEACNRQPCEAKRTTAWTPWQTAHDGNISGTGYMEKRYKFSCKAQTPEQIKLTLSKEEQRYCSGDGSCGSTPVTDSTNGWSAWGPWDSCSAECGGGYQTSTRTCLKQQCDGSAKMQRACNIQSCIDGWGCWGDWTPCSSSCGTGRTERRRPCLAPGGCDGDSAQLSHCEGPPCETMLGWSPWTAWSSCDLQDEQHRRRKCIVKNTTDSEMCQGPDTETRLCSSNEELVNEFHTLPVERSPQHSNPPPEAVHLTMAATVGIAGASLLAGILLAAGPLFWMAKRKNPGIPSSPHYISQQNSYVSVPLKEVSKKRQPSFTGLTLLKPNNINNDRNNGTTSTPKLYPKAIAGEYETATMKRNSHSTHGNNGNCRNNIDLDQEKFY